MDPARELSDSETIKSTSIIRRRIMTFTASELAALRVADRQSDKDADEHRLWTQACRERKRARLGDVAFRELGRAAKAAWRARVTGNRHLLPLTEKPTQSEDAFK